MSSFHFVFISTSKSIADKVCAYASSKGLDIEPCLSSMEKALPVARQMLSNGVDVIIGGGATGKLLRHYLSAPIVTVDRSDVDLILALREGMQYGRHIALTQYGLPDRSLEVLANVLNIEIDSIFFLSTQQLKKSLKQTIKTGVQCVVGSGISVEIARQYGCPGIVVMPGEPAIQRACEEAVNIAQSNQREREKTAWFQGVLDSMHEGLIGVNPNGEVYIFNKSANKILGVTEPAPEKILHRILHETGLPEALQHDNLEQNSIRRVLGQEVVVNNFPIKLGDSIQGAISAFKPVSEIRTVDSKIRNKLRQSGFTSKYNFNDLTGDSEIMRRLRKKAELFAQTDAPILITGESGTGKELLAHAIHAASPRAMQPFVAINCAALPESLLESELFGYVEGAFTDARKSGKDGLFTLSDKGTIFLDEIGDISPLLQAHLLRVLESGEILRIGDNKLLKVNARVIASTWKNLPEEIQKGKFRLDLYYRLAKLCLFLPPLRERPEDIAQITKKLLAIHGISLNYLSEVSLEHLRGHYWVGNIRELDALLLRYTTLNKTGKPDDSLLLELLAELNQMSPQPEGPAQALTGNLKDNIAEYEKRLISECLQRYAFDKQRTARHLGIDISTLWRKINMYNIDKG